MGNKLASVAIRISANAAEAERVLRSFEGSMQKWGKTISNIGKSMSMYVTAPLVAAATASVNAANTQTQAEAKLLNALKGREDVQRRLIEQAGELQSKSTFGDEAIIEQQAFLAALGLTEEQISSTITAAVQLSSALGMDLTSSVKNLAKTYGGMTGELGESIPALKNLTAEQLKTGEAVKYVNDNYKGFAEIAASTGTGPLVQLKNTIGDIAEQFGVILLPSLQKVANALKSVAEWIQNLSPEWKETIVNVGAVVAAIGPLLVVGNNALTLFKLLIPAISGVAGALTTLTATPIGGAIVAFGGLVALLAKANSEAKNLRENFLLYAQELSRGVAQKEYELTKRIFGTASTGEVKRVLAESEAKYASGVLDKGNLKESMALYEKLPGRIQALKDILSERNAVPEVPEVPIVPEVLTEQLGLIGKLEDKMKSLREALQLAQTEGEIRSINAQLKETETELNRLKNLGEQKPIVQAAQKPIVQAAQMQVPGVSWGVKMNANIVDEAIESSRGLREFKQMWQDLGTEANRAQQLSQTIASTLGNAFANIATTVSEGLGKLWAGEQVNFGDMFLKLLGQTLQMLGSALITFATTMEAFQAALATSWLTPWVAIGIGAAAIATGAAFVSMANKPIKLAKGCLAYGPTLAVVGDNPNAMSDPEVVAPLSKLRSMVGGQQLELVGDVAFELRGDTMRAVLNRENVRLKRL